METLNKLLFAFANKWLRVRVKLVVYLLSAAVRCHIFIKIVYYNFDHKYFYFQTNNSCITPVDSCIMGTIFYSFRFTQTKFQHDLKIQLSHTLSLTIYTEALAFFNWIPMFYGIVNCVHMSSGLLIRPKKVTHLGYGI